MMDTTEQYMKQCEKAVEIQEIWLQGIERCQWFVCKRDVEAGYYIPIHHTDGAPELINRQFFTWLPTQDRLQELSRLSWRDFDLKCSINASPTKEQAGIQVVMKECWDKVWNGEDWCLTEP